MMEGFAHIYMYSTSRKSVGSLRLGVMSLAGISGSGDDENPHHTAQHCNARGAGIKACLDTSGLLPAKKRRVCE
jgi:hypothetical protein